MGKIVRCDVCGKIYNESNLTTHKRRSHGMPGASPRSAESGTTSIEVILSMFERLPEDRKREVLSRLMAIEQKKPVR